MRFPFLAWPVDRAMDAMASGRGWANTCIHVTSPMFGAYKNAEFIFLACKGHVNPHSCWL